MAEEPEHAHDDTHDTGAAPAPAAVDAAVLDARGLRAMAHPLRVRLVGLLRRHGPATATRLAARLEINSGSASYHLRQLAAAGFVEEDAERGNARERWWRSVHQKTWFDDPELAAREPGAALAYLQSVAATYTLRAQRALNELQTMPRPWRDTLDMSDWSLRITPDEALTLREKLRAVLEPYRRDVPGEEEQAPEGAERVSVILHLLPEPDDPEQR